MVGAALSRECIAHECAPTEMSNMFDEDYHQNDYYSHQKTGVLATV